MSDALQSRIWFLKRVALIALVLFRTFEVIGSGAALSAISSLIGEFLNFFDHIDIGHMLLVVIEDELKEFKELHAESERRHKSWPDRLNLVVVDSMEVAVLNVKLCE